MRPIMVKGKRSRVAARLIDFAGLLTARIHHRGFYNLTQFVAQCAPKGQNCVIELASDSKYQIDLRDPYWNRLIYAGFAYEPELEHVLKYLAEVPYVFIDGGANGGYWSILASSRQFGSHSAVAFEPIPKTFDRLVVNRRLNDCRFEIDRRALSEHGSQRLVMKVKTTGPSSVAGASLVDGDVVGQGYENVEVETVSLDTILESIPDERPVLLKLDIEGVEAPVLDSSKHIAERDFLVVYEDHGKDYQCTSSAWVLAQGWPVFFIHDSGQIQSVRDLNSVRHLKSRRHRGYNFISTTKNSSFHEKLDGLIDVPQ